MGRNKGLSAVWALAAMLYLIAPVTIAQTNTEAKKLKLIVGGYVMDTTESRTNTSIEIDASLENSFSRFSDIQVLDKNDFPQVNLTALQERSNPEALDGVDAIVFGNYIIVNEYVRINSVIFNAQTGLYHRINYSRGRLSGLNVLLDEVANDVYDKLGEISPILQSSAKKIAIATNYRILSGDYSNIAPVRSQAEAFSREVMQELDDKGPANTEVLSWQELLDYRDITRAELITKLKPDMYVSLTYVFDEQKMISLQTEFSIIEQSRTQIQKRDFVLPELKKDHYTDIPFMEFVVNELNDFLNRIINDKGQWEYISFPSKTDNVSTDPEVLIVKAEKFSKQNDFYLSNYYYYEALNNLPENKNPADIRLQLGFNKVYLNRLKEADAEFEYVIANSNEQDYAYLGKSLIEYYKTNYEAANEYLDKARERGFDNAHMLDALRGYNYFRLNEYANAIEAFNEALNTNPGKVKIKLVNNLSEVSLKIHVGLSYVGLNQFDEAVAYYEKLKAKFPRDEEVPYYLGNAYSKRGVEKYFAGNYAGAIKDFFHSIELYQNSNIHDYLRTSLIYENQFEKATAFITDEIENGNYDPRFIWFTHGMDIRMLMLDDSQRLESGAFDETIGNEAIKSFDRSVGHEPNDPMAWYYIGNIHILLGRLDEGLEYMKKAFEKDNYDFEIQSGLMQAYLLTNQFDACEDFYKTVSKINRRTDVTPRARALMNFFLISASEAMDKKQKRELRELESLIKEKTVIDQWSFMPYAAWLDNCPCNLEAKNTLTQLFGKMKTLDIN